MLAHDKFNVDFMVDIERNYSYVSITLKETEKNTDNLNHEYQVFSTFNQDYLSWIYKIKSSFNFPIELVNTLNYIYPNSLNFEFLQILNFQAYTFISDLPIDIIHIFKALKDININKKLSNINNEIEHHSNSILITNTDLFDSSKTEEKKLENLVINNNNLPNISDNLTNKSSGILEIITEKVCFDSISQKVSVLENKENLNYSENLEELVTEDNEINELNKGDYNEHVLENVEKIISIGSSFSFLFEEEEISILNKYKNELDYKEKKVFLKFLLSGNIWINKNKLKFSNDELNTSQINEIFKKLENLNLLNTPARFINTVYDHNFISKNIIKNGNLEETNINKDDKKIIINKRELINFISYL